MATRGGEARADEVKARAEASFKKEERAKEGARAMMEYQANSKAAREKMAQLKALRLAKEAADKAAESSQSAAPQALSLETNTSLVHNYRAACKASGEPRVRNPVRRFCLKRLLARSFHLKLTAQNARDVLYPAKSVVASRTAALRTYTTESSIL